MGYIVICRFDYNVTEDPHYRAIGGFSMAGATTAYALFHCTDEFDTYLLLSALVTFDIGIDPDIEPLKDKTILVGYGQYDMTTNRCIYSAFYTDEEGNALSLNNNEEDNVLEYYLYDKGEGIHDRSY